MNFVYIKRSDACGNDDTDSDTQGFSFVACADCITDLYTGHSLK